MVILKTNPVGIDVVINNIQKSIVTNLETKWGSLDAYGRVYKKETSDGIRLERYVSNGEYKPVLFSEGNKMFFVQGNKPINNKVVFTNDLWLVCILNIDNINGVTHRADEEVHADLLTELNRVVGINDIQGLEYGMENLKRVVEDSFGFGNFKASNIHPYHVFMVKLKAIYSLNNNKC